MKFLNSWTIALDKLPTYAAFKKSFEIELDNAFMQKIYNSNNDVFTDERKALLLPIINAMKGNKLKVKHNQRYGLGRFYADNSISPICVSRHIKHTLFNRLGWCDLDMIKGHPTIIYSIAKKNGLHLEHFKTYLDNPEAIFKQLINFYSCEDEEPLTEDNVKDIFNISIYGGGFSTWVKQMRNEDIILRNEIEHPFISQFIKSCRDIMDIIYVSNPSIAEKVKGELTDLYAIKCRVMSYWCGTIENHILFTCYNLLKKREVFENNNVVLEYDGLCFEFKPNLKNDRDFINSLLSDINDTIKKDTGLDVKMKFKDYKTIHLHNVEAIEITNNINEEISETRTYDIVKNEFEKSHSKIINRNIFIRQFENRIVFMKKEHLNNAYEDMKYEDVIETKDGLREVQKPFLKEWLNDEFKLKYDDLGVFPTGLKCPDNYFNTWTSFDMELIDEYTPNEEAVNTIKNHIKILCGNDDVVADYFEKWIAQMIQYPAIKTICPTLISKEGAGKGTLLQLLTKMLGSTKVFETTQPSRDVWGEFNGLMADAFLVNLNELSKKETMESEGRIKGLITDPTMKINNKGVSQFPINSFHRFIITTNNEEPIATSKDDRRKLIIRSSDELCGNKEYFKKMYELLDDTNAIKSVYEYFKSIPDMDKFGSIPMPTTEHQENLKEMNANPIESWLKDFVERKLGNPTVNITSKKLYEDFDEWINNSNITNYQCDALKFAVRLKNLKLPYITKGHTKIGSNTIFDIEGLSKHYGIGCLLEVKK
jgi:hypothetical protein